MNKLWIFCSLFICISLVHAVQNPAEPNEGTPPNRISGGIVFLILFCCVLIGLGIASGVLFWLSGTNIKVRKFLMRFVPEKYLRAPHFDESASKNYQKLEETYGENLFDDDSDDFLEEDASVLDPDDL